MCPNCDHDVDRHEDRGDYHIRGISGRMDIYYHCRDCDCIIEVRNLQ